MDVATEYVRDVPASGQNSAKTPAPYQGFNEQYIDGSRRPGKHGGVQVDTDPYSGATLAETVMANRGDLDDAYYAAARAQVSWAAQLPAERTAVGAVISPALVAISLGHGWTPAYIMLLPSFCVLLRDRDPLCRSTCGRAKPLTFNRRA